MRDGGVPDVIVTINGELTEEQAAEFRERFAAILASPRYAREARRATLRANLPRRTRLRLWLTSRVDSVAICMVDHRRFGAAQALWRVSGLWQATARRRAR